MTSAIIDGTSAVDESSAVPKKSCPQINSIMAKGNVSSNGAFEETSPSRFKPLLRLKNDPVISPRRQKKPSIVPSRKALAFIEPRFHHVSSYPVNGWTKMPTSVWEYDAGSPRPTAMSMHMSPLVSDPPMSPFHVFPSPSKRSPSRHDFPPSMGHGP